ncbi:MAG: hypothetical protein OEZ10_09715 [Gammaproteobacteria bacterium]|nr:hypothetical protein [Gammaproteobacteria bacterium]
MKVLKSVLSIAFGVLLLAAPLAQAKLLKPFILGNEPASTDMAATVASVKEALTKGGFTVVGSYSPYDDATVIAATHPELTAAASAAKNGGFGVAQRVSVTKVKGKLQVGYMNPEYLGTAYGLGSLATVSAALKAALGAVQEYGSKGVNENDLKPGKYHYAMFMPYFEDTSLLNKFDSYKSAVDTVEANLAKGAGGTKKVYRIDIPGKEISVFGVAIPVGDNEKYAKAVAAAKKDGFSEAPSRVMDTDKEIMDIIDFEDIRSTAYLPYELMVQGKEAVALAGRFRIAVHFPDTKMIGDHGFTKIMTAPGGIKTALEAVAGYK